MNKISFALAAIVLASAVACKSSTAPDETEKLVCPVASDVQVTRTGVTVRSYGYFKSTANTGEVFATFITYNSSIVPPCLPFVR